MKLNKDLIKKINSDFPHLLKSSAEELIQGVNEHIKKYGALHCRDIDIYQRHCLVLSEYLPNYGDFAQYLCLLGGEDKIPEYPKMKSILPGAIIFLQQNGFIYYLPGEIMTKSPLKKQPELKPKKK